MFKDTTLKILKRTMSAMPSFRNNDDVPGPKPWSDPDSDPIGDWECTLEEYERQLHASEDEPISEELMGLLADYVDPKDLEDYNGRVRERNKDQK